MSDARVPLPPAEVQAALASGVARLCGRDADVVKVLSGGADGADRRWQWVFTADPHEMRVERGGLDPLSRKKLVEGWRLVARSGSTVAAAYLSIVGSEWQVSSVSFGEHPTDPYSAGADPKTLAERLQGRTCEARVLEVPALSLRAYWFVPDEEGAEEWISVLSDLDPQRFPPNQLVPCSAFRQRCVERAYACHRPDVADSGG